MWSCNLPLAWLRSALPSGLRKLLVHGGFHDLPFLELWDAVLAVSSLETLKLSYCSGVNLELWPPERLIADCGSHPALREVFLTGLMYTVDGSAVRPPEPPLAKPPYWNHAGEEAEDGEHTEDSASNSEDSDSVEARFCRFALPDKGSDYWTRLVAIPEVRFHHHGVTLVNDDGSLARDYFRLDIQTPGRHAVHLVIKED